ncbi:MAG: hypothetical protein OEZ06_29870, partial [Myxococcales bacterium]|nr:hypothetical protein [Myxococcales bacterium]
MFAIRKSEAEHRETQRELERLREDAQALLGGGSIEALKLPTLAYSPTMRVMLQRLDAEAERGTPLMLVAERGSPVAPLALRLHLAEERDAGGSFVVGECAAVARGEGERALFGVGGDGGVAGDGEVA